MSCLPRCQPDDALLHPADALGRRGLDCLLRVPQLWAQAFHEQLIPSRLGSEALVTLNVKLVLAGNGSKALRPSCAIVSFSEVLLSTYVSLSCPERACAILRSSRQDARVVHGSSVCIGVARLPLPHPNTMLRCTIRAPSAYPSRHAAS